MMVINSDCKLFLTMFLMRVQAKKQYLKVASLLFSIFLVVLIAQSLPTARQAQARLTPCLE